MAYNKTTWVDFETKLTAANLNKIENGLADASAKADNATNTINSWGASTGPVGKVPGLVEDVQDHNTRLNTIELDLYAENDGIEDRLDVAEGDIDDLETEVATIKQSHGSSLSTIGTGLSGHISNKNNPHEVTPAQLGVYTKTEVDMRLSPNTAVLNLTRETTSYDTLVMNDVHLGKQRVLLTANKTDLAGDTYMDHSGYETALWYLTETDTPTWNVDLDTDMDHFSNLLSNCSYEIINETMDGIKIMCDQPDYISSMRYVYPVYATTSYGWALNYCSDAAYYAYATIILYSPSQHRYFLVPTGVNGGTYEHLMFYLLDERYLLVRGNYVYLRTFDLKRYGDDLELYSIGFNGAGADNGYDYDTSVIELKETHAECASFLLESTNGVSIIPMTSIPLANREFSFDIGTSSTNAVFSTYGYDQPYPLVFTLQYARNDSDLVSLGKNVPISTDEFTKELDIKIKRALFDLISTGTGDPDASTPGRLYFKYLE